MMNPDLLNFLPPTIKDSLNNIDLDKLYEIRLRTDYPIKVLYHDKTYYLSNKGISLYSNDSIICTSQHINYIIRFVTEKSIYAFNDSIRQGYLTTKEGVRIGLAGYCVTNQGYTTTIKDFTSLLIRVPHHIKNCSDKVIDYILKENYVKNTLIVSPPGYGKTTFLYDIARNIDRKNIGNILVIDERGEFSRLKGENIDTISNSDKLFAFRYGIRSLSPDVVITDELANDTDWQCVMEASSAGVSIIASCHGRSIDDVKAKSKFVSSFQLFVILDYISGIHSLKGVYNKDFKLL